MCEIASSDYKCLYEESADALTTPYTVDALVGYYAKTIKTKVASGMDADDIADCQDGSFDDTYPFLTSCSYLCHTDPDVSESYKDGDVDTSTYAESFTNSNETVAVCIPKGTALYCACT